MEEANNISLPEPLPAEIQSARRRNTAALGPFRGVRVGWIRCFYKTKRGHASGGSGRIDGNRAIAPCRILPDRSGIFTKGTRTAAGSFYKTNASVNRAG